MKTILLLFTLFSLNCLGAGLTTSATNGVATNLTINTGSLSNIVINVPDWDVTQQWVVLTNAQDGRWLSIHYLGTQGAPSTINGWYITDQNTASLLSFRTNGAIVFNNFGDLMVLSNGLVYLPRNLFSASTNRASLSQNNNPLVSGGYFTCPNAQGFIEGSITLTNQGWGYISNCTTLFAIRIGAVTASTGTNSYPFSMRAGPNDVVCWTNGSANAGTLSSTQWRP